MNRTNGFTLIELMIVVSIIGILSSIAIPNLLRARLNANESAVIEELEAICTAQHCFNTVRQRFGTFDEMTAADPPYLDEDWVDGRTKHGYVFTMPVVANDFFEAYADPIVPGRSGERWFRIDATGATRFSTAGKPDATSEEIGD